MPPQLSDRWVNDSDQRRWLIARGFSVSPGDAGLSIPLGDAFAEWRLYVRPPGERWEIARHGPDACCTLPRAPITLASIIAICRELGVPLRTTSD